jgi:hypothetical protein
VVGLTSEVPIARSAKHQRASSPLGQPSTDPRCQPPLVRTLPAAPDRAIQEWRWRMGLPVLFRDRDCPYPQVRADRDQPRPVLDRRRGPHQQTAIRSSATTGGTSVSRHRSPPRRRRNRPGHGRSPHRGADVSSSVTPGCPLGWPGSRPDLPAATESPVSATRWAAPEARSVAPRSRCLRLHHVPQPGVGGP